MRVWVMSDSHGKKDALRRGLKRVSAGEVVLFLGDGQRELEGCREEFPRLDIRAVRGNCDYGSSLPLVGILDLKEGRVLYTHGHMFGVKTSLERLKAAALENGVQAAVFGHSHQRMCGYEDGIHFLNPGSLAEPRDSFGPSMGFIDFTPAGIVTQTMDLPETPIIR